MDVEYTGRQAVISDDLRALAEPFLDRMDKMLGRGSSAHVILTAEKNRQIAEVTVKTRAHDLVSTCESTASAEAALRQALEKTEAQAIRFKEKRATQKRLPKDEKAVVETALTRPGKAKRTALLAEAPVSGSLVEEVASKNGNGATKLNGSAVHDHATEPHVTRVIDAVALRPMSLEEAVKEMEERNREVFIFRDNGGLIRVLHCRRDNQLELIELP